MNFRKICAMLVAKECRNNGHTIAEIAVAAKVSPSTIRRWLKAFP